MFDPVQKTSVADQVAEKLRTAILGGRWSPGQSLPSERDLAEQFAVNRSTVREALHRVESLGLVEMKHGESTRVRDFLVEAGLELLPYLIAPKGTPDPAMIGDLLELRVMLLAWTAGRAAANATEPALARLEAALSELRAAKTAEEAQRLDFVFFEVMVEMTGNKVLGLLSNAVRSVYLQNRQMFVAMYTPGLFDLTAHEAAVAAIRNRDEVAAARAMETSASAALGLFREVMRG